MKYIVCNKVSQFLFSLTESSQSGHPGASSSRIPNKPPSPDGPVLARSQSSSPEGRPPSLARPCILAMINDSRRDQLIEYHHRPINVENLIYPNNYQFLTTNSRGELRFIEPNESLPTVTYRSTGDIIGILDHDGIFRGLYNLIGRRVKIIYGESYIHQMAPTERYEFPDGELRVVRIVPVRGPTSSG